MALRTMKGPEPLWRVKIVRRKAIPNPAYTGYGCGEPVRLLTDERVTEYYGPYVSRHGAVTVHKGEGSTREYDYEARKYKPRALRWDVVSADIETCEPEWKVVT